MKTKLPCICIRTPSSILPSSVVIVGQLVRGLEVSQTFPKNRAQDQNFIYLFVVLRRFQHCTGHITTGSWKARGNKYVQFVRVLYCKLPTNGKQLPAFPLKAVPGIEPEPHRWEARVLPLCHRGPFQDQNHLSLCQITPKACHLNTNLNKLQIQMKVHGSESVAHNSSTE